MRVRVVPRTSSIKSWPGYISQSVIVALGTLVMVGSSKSVNRKPKRSHSRQVYWHMSLSSSKFTP